MSNDTVVLRHDRSMITSAAAFRHMGEVGRRGVRRLTVFLGEIALSFLILTTKDVTESVREATSEERATTELKEGEILAEDQHQVQTKDQSNLQSYQMEVDVADEKRHRTRSKVPLEPAIQELFRSVCLKGCGPCADLKSYTH
ncbi:hypothetical protein MHYP_G00133450 [Metynnis hypsauchen]